MKPPMLHTAYKVATTRNAYGDYILGAETELPCHFREITSQVFDMNETINCDAMAWFMPDSGIMKKDIIKIYDTYYQVERRAMGRKLRKTAVQFIEVNLSKYGSIS
jgi:hypothetical protein